MLLGLVYLLYTSSYNWNSTLYFTDFPANGENFSLSCSEIDGNVFHDMEPFLFILDFYPFGHRVALAFIDNFMASNQLHIYKTRIVMNLG